MNKLLGKIKECVVCVLGFKLRDFLPGLRVWHVLALASVITLILVLRSPGGRPFDDGTSDRSPIADLDKPERILESFSAPLDTSSRPFASPVVLHLARACDAAYSQGETTVPRLFYELKFDRVIPLTAGSDFAFVGIKEKMAVVVFRGTNDISDWYKNVQVAWQPISNGRLHSGFWVAYGSLKEQILVQLKAQPLSSVWITGHSLGGAMALCCAYDLKSNTDFNIDGVVTFGQPKLADRDLAKHIDTIFKGRYLAIIADEDPVADAVPLCQFCGAAIWFKDDTIR